MTSSLMAFPLRAVIWAVISTYFFSYNLQTSSSDPQPAYTKGMINLACPKLCEVSAYLAFSPGQYIHWGSVYLHVFLLVLQNFPPSLSCQNTAHVLLFCKTFPTHLILPLSSVAEQINPVTLQNTVHFSVNPIGLYYYHCVFVL